MVEALSCRAPAAWLFFLAAGLAGSFGPARAAASDELRVALAEGAAAARISAPAPFLIRSGALEIEASSVLIAPEVGAAASVLALGSFADEAAARREAESFRSGQNGGATVSLERHQETGRYLAVVAGSGEGEAARLRAGGFPRTGVFELPTPVGDSLVVRPRAGPPIRIPGGAALSIEPPPARFLEWEGKPYRGGLAIFRDGDGVTVINRVGVEDYLRGVVPSELPPDLFPEPEALKAQALAARTYALRTNDAWRERGFDLCAGPACQVYGGVSTEHPLADDAVRATAGEALFHEGELIEALYTAACGGSTENAENVFQNPAPYLVARACLREGGGIRLRSEAPGAPLDAAIASLAGALPDGWSEAGLGGPASAEDALRVVDAAVRWLGFPRCDLAEPPAPHREGHLSLDGFAEAVEAIRCRARRPAVAPPGHELRPARRLVAEGLLDPSERGLDPARSVSRREVVGVAANLLRLDGRLFRRGQIREVGAGVVIEPAPLSGAAQNRGGPPKRIRLEPGPGARLFRETVPARIPGRAERAPLPAPAAELRLRVGDFVRYHAPPPDSGDGPRLFRVLILEDLGEALDRFSRQRAWMVPKNNADLSAAVQRIEPIGEIVALDPLETGRSGRIIRLRVEGTRGEIEVRGLEIRRLLGISENLFVAEPRQGAAGEVTEWWFSGRGWGHGLGLCQSGAYGMAAAGASYLEILAHYYPGVDIGPASRAAFRE